MKLAHAALIGSGAIAIVVGAVTSCQRAELPHPTAPEDANTARVVVVRKGSPRPTTAAAVAFVEIAATRAARERGLSGRRSLEPDHGMLFVYAMPTPRRFWMKDCLMGLDIAFVRADGTVARIATLPGADGAPLEDVPSAESGEPVRYVVEMEPGWFARHGVSAGARIDVSAAIAGVAAE